MVVEVASTTVSSSAGGGRIATLPPLNSAPRDPLLNASQRPATSKAATNSVPPAMVSAIIRRRDNCISTAAAVAPWDGGLEKGLRIFHVFFGFRHSGDATHASGRHGVRDAEPNGRFGISTTLYRPMRSDLRGFRRLRP